MKLLGFVGSLRAGSINRMLLQAAVDATQGTAQWSIAEIGTLPLFNADIADDDPSLAPVKALQDAVATADGLVFATPEYNYSIPGVLKNAIDWASRPAYKSGFVGKPALIMSASMGPVGGARAQAHLKDILLGVLAKVHPAPELTLGGAGSMVADGRLADDGARAKVERLIGQFVAAIAG